MTYVRRIVEALAWLHAYAMAPDDYDAIRRRDVIERGGEALGAVDNATWLEGWMLSNPNASLTVECRLTANPAVRWLVSVGGPGGTDGSGPGLLEAVASVRRQLDPTANP